MYVVPLWKFIFFSLKEGFVQIFSDEKVYFITSISTAWLGTYKL